MQAVNFHATSKLSHYGVDGTGTYYTYFQVEIHTLILIMEEIIKVLIKWVKENSNEAPFKIINISKNPILQSKENRCIILLMEQDEIHI